MKTIFEKIRDKELPAKMVFEDAEIMVFHDISPAAPVHVLIVPKKAYATLEDIPLDDPLPSKLIQTARKMAHELNIAKNYKIFMNVGHQVQQVPHVHLHLMGGWKNPKP